MKATHPRDQGKLVWWITALCRRPLGASHTVHFLFLVLQMTVKVLAKIAMMKASVPRAPTVCQAQSYTFYMMHVLNPHEKGVQSTRIQSWVFSSCL